MASIIFVEPRSPGYNIYSKFKLPLLGPLYLGTILKQAGHDVQVLNEKIHEFDIENLHADILIITALTSTAPRGYEIARIFKKNNPGSRTIMGGVHATFNREEALEHVDYVAVGEGEGAIVEAIARVLSGKMDGRIITGRHVADLDTVPPPDFSLMGNISDYILPIITSRGCPFDCNFCTVTAMFGRKYRTRSEDRIMDELRTFEKKAQNVFFYDDNFTAFRERSRSLMRRMVDEGLNTSWFAQVRTDVARDEEVMKLMSESGCHTVFIGMESINDEALRKMNKKQTRKDILAAIKKLHDHGIKVHGMFMFGSDEDTKDTPEKTVEFCRESDVDSVQYLILTPFPGARTYNDMDAAGRIFNKDWSFYDAHHVVFKPRKINAYELQMSQYYAHKDFYNITRGIKRLLHLDMTFGGINFYAKHINRLWLKANEGYLDLLQKGGNCLKQDILPMVGSITDTVKDTVLGSGGKGKESGKKSAS